MDDKFTKFTEVHYMPFKANFTESSGTLEQIKTAALSKLPEDNLKQVMKTVEKKLKSECQSLSKIQKFSQNGARLEFVIMPWLKQQILKAQATKMTQVDKRVYEVDLAILDVLKVYEDA